MGFFDKMRAGFARFMAGRYGSDQLNFAMLIVALVGSLIGSLTGLGIVTIAADALLIVMFYRMLSKDRYRRAHENAAALPRSGDRRRGGKDRRD